MDTLILSVIWYIIGKVVGSSNIGHTKLSKDIHARYWLVNKRNWNLFSLEGIFSFTMKKYMITSPKWLHVWLYSKLLLWILCVKNNSHILVGHVIIDDEVVRRWRVPISITFISFVWHPWLMTKWCRHAIVITMTKKWQVIWYEHKKPCLPTYLLTYLPPPYHPTNCYLPHNLMVTWNTHVK